MTSPPEPSHQPALHGLPPGSMIAPAAGIAALAASLFTAPGWLIVSLAVAVGAVVMIVSTRRWRKLRSRIEHVLEDAHESERLQNALETTVDSLRADQQDLLTIIESVGSPVLATDADGVIRLCNVAGRELFGSTVSPLGRLVEHVFTQPEMLVIHAKALRGERTTRRLRIAVDDANVRIFEVTATPAQLAASTTDSTDVVLTLIDVTELATAMQLKTDFVANASHELRTPLASIRVAAETLGTLDADEHAMRTKLVVMLERNAIRLEDMVSDLLDLSRLEAPEGERVLKDVDLSELCAQFESLYESQCHQRHLELLFELPTGAQLLRTDPTLLTLILKNLVENALKFARPDTAVRVRIVELPQAFKIEVIDQGIGIPLNAQQRVFERFFQVDPARPGGGVERGTGLGLSIVKHAVRALDGSVRIESVYGEGTTMIVELPIMKS